jgi:DNA-binding NarL/FixJ family response regulator
MSKPRVLVADDHQMFAQGLRGLLEADYDVVATVADGRALVAAAVRHRPDVIVADVSMPILNGIEAARQLRDQGVAAKVVFVTMHKDVAYAQRALAAGAVGFLLKHSAFEELQTAVREVLRGRTYVTPAVAEELFQTYRTGTAQPPPERPLTTRQREVLQLFAEGRSAKEVAAVLKVSTRTAEAHKARIQQVLGLHTTAELVQYAIRHGIIAAE